MVVVAKKEPPPPPPFKVGAAEIWRGAAGGNFVELRRRAWAGEAARGDKTNLGAEISAFPAAAAVCAPSRLDRPPVVVVDVVFGAA